MKRLLFLLLAATTLAGATHAPARAAVAAPLRLAYSGQGSRAFGACSVNPDGSNNVCVANGARPAAAPNGDLLFVDMTDDTTTNYRAIYRVNGDGSNLRLVHFQEFAF